MVGEQIGEEGKTAAACGGRWTGVSGVSGGEGERDCRSMDGRNFLSRRRSGGVKGARVVVGDGIRGVVGEPGGGKSRGYLMRFLTLDGSLESLCVRRRRSRNSATHATRRRPRAELRAMATLVPVANSVSGVVAAVEMPAVFEEPSVVCAAMGTLLLAVATVAAPLCVARTVLSQAELWAAADDVCAGSWMSVHSPTEPSTSFASVIHV